MNNNPMPPHKRETIIQRRLRRARGEVVDDNDDDFLDFEDMSPLRHERLSSIPPQAHYGLGTGVGCSQNMLLGLLFALGLLVVVFFFGSQLFQAGTTFNPLQQVISGLVPSFFQAPTPTIHSTASIVRRVQQLQRMETTSYSVEKVIDAHMEGNAFQNLLFGDRLLLIAHGTVIAGIDLSQLSENDLTISDDGKTIMVRLPPVQVFHATLDNSKTQVYHREQGLLASPDKDLETQARQIAEREILHAACEEGMMQRATQDGRHAIEQLLSMLDFERIDFIDEPVPQCPDTVAP